MADTTQIPNLNIVNIGTSYDNQPIDAGLSGVCLITQGNDTDLKSYYTAQAVENDFGNDSYVSNFANNYFNGGTSPLFQVITYQNSDDTDNAVGALRKYYDCEAEYFVFLATDDQKQTALALAQLIENQNNKVFAIDVPTQSGENVDFSFFDTLKPNKSTIILSLPVSDGNINHYQFASKVIGVRANEAPNASLQNIHQLSGLSPQDKYNFTTTQLKPYQDNGIATYAYRNDIPMLTNGNSPSGYQWSNMITRDYLNKDITQRVTNVIINNNLSYNDAGINAITDQIKIALNDAQNNGYIDSYSVQEPNAQQISLAKKESGELDGLGYTWTPTNNITGAMFEQGIQLPNLGGA